MVADWMGFWRKKGLVNRLLLPAAAAYAVVVAARRQLYKNGILKTREKHPPVLVVGNIVTGGAGKTPLVIALLLALKKRGLKPGAIARGVGGNFNGVWEVNPNDDWRRCGDETLLIKRLTDVPICLSKRRSEAAAHHSLADCDLIISDDGLQHYALHRAAEICVVNGAFGVGNGWRLPAGPLREGVKRLNKCDYVVINRGLDNNGGKFQWPGAFNTKLSISGFYRLIAPQEQLSVSHFADKRVAAVCGLAVPENFFNTLRAVGVTVQQKYPLPDHTRMDKRRLAAISADCIIMSEKDAIKYGEDDERLCAMKICFEPPSGLIDAIIEKVHGC